MNPQEKKQLKNAAEGLLREGNELQEAAQLKAAQSLWSDAAEAIACASTKYEEALALSLTNNDALFNLGTCELQRAEIISSAGGREDERCTLLQLAVARFQQVLTQDTSCRGETSGLAHKAIAGVLLQQARSNGAAQERRQILEQAVGHCEHAERIQIGISGGAGAVEAALYFQVSLQSRLTIQFQLTTFSTC
jgi:hypothetical protein